MRKGICY